ncbi:ATPase WRNIP1-like [Liolophura sinensis]|uniref:ATPase WRNIP1-like n=1 Tax=Liolophura sinensis TaxID=3198878 RepID=UPI0031590E5B
MSVSQAVSLSNKRKSDDKLAWGKIFSQAKRSKLDATISRPQTFCSSSGCESTSETVIGKSSPAEKLSYPISPENMAFVKKTDRNNDTDSGSSGIRSVKMQFAPLPERMRPVTLEEYVGQEQAVGKRSLLRSILKTASIPSLMFWGPPGCGKTTLAKIIANHCKQHSNTKFVQLSAASVGVADVRNTIKTAKTDQTMFKRKTILFLDEIHRFNKLQQDALLPHVEDGTITLIGATTENPSFYVNSALLSRSRVIVLEKLSSESLERILLRAVERLDVMIKDTGTADQESNSSSLWIEKEAITALAKLCDGDARAALNSLDLAVQSCIGGTSQVKGQSTAKVSGGSGREVITVEQIKESLQRSHILYDKTGEEHYNCMSALQKSIRGSDANAALYWTARMLEGGENPLVVARRLVRTASEDVGLADSQALPLAVSAFQACHFIGMPECDVILAQCAAYLARAPKSVEVYLAYDRAKNCVRNHQGPMPGVPLHLRNASTKLMKDLGYGKGYKGKPDQDGSYEQEYFPEGLEGTDFFSCH